jgi:predicted nucleic acid-binding protein
VGAISFYLDASVLIAMLKPEPLSDRADSFARQHTAGLIVSDFAAAEFASAVARWVRTRELNLNEGRTVLDSFDILAARLRRVEMASNDLPTATMFLRRLDLPLRTPDAVHIAIAQRVGAILVTFDRQMAASARTLGSPVETP